MSMDLQLLKVLVLQGMRDLDEAREVCKIAESLARSEAAHKADAERYRWLRANLTRLQLNTSRTVNREIALLSLQVLNDWPPPDEESVEQAIDSARGSDDRP